MNWYILKVSKGQDNKVKKALEEKIKAYNLQSDIDHIVTPTETYYDVKKGKRIKKERPMLAGYLLVHANINEMVLSKILTIKGALGFMGESRKNPTVVRDHEALRMIGRMEESNEVPANLWMPGETVKIISGPFSTFNATIKTVEEQKKKLNVEVKIFGRATDVELDFISVEKV